MNSFSLSLSIKVSLSAILVLLPFAHLQTIVLGIPIYTVEWPVLFAAFLAFFGWRRGTWSPWVPGAPHTPLVIAALLLCFGALLSFLANPFSFTGLGMLKTWFFFPILAGYLWLSARPTSADLERIFLLWVGTGGAVAVTSLVFFFSGTTTYDGRLAAWYGSPNYLAFFLAPPALLALSRIFSGRLMSGDSVWRASIFFAPPILAALFLTRSYSAWLSLGVTLLIFSFVLYRNHFSLRKKINILCGIGLVFFLFFASETGSEKWKALADRSSRSSLASRVMIWEAAWRMASDHPLLGIGPGRFQETYLAYQRYFPPYLEWAVPKPHNLGLALWLETGILGLLGFTWLVGAWLWYMRLFWRVTVRQLEKNQAAAITSITVFFLILGLADTPFFKTDLAFLFWLTLAFGVSITALPSSTNRGA